MMGAMPAHFYQNCKKLPYLSILMIISYFDLITTIETTKKQQLPRPRFEPATFGTWSRHTNHYTTQEKTHAKTVFWNWKKNVGNVCKNNCNDCRHICPQCVRVFLVSCPASICSLPVMPASTWGNCTFFQIFNLPVLPAARATNANMLPNLVT